ncbi:TPA: hypothetical protein ACH3X3_001411 [Trebouxia sp. C0006]
MTTVSELVDKGDIPEERKKHVKNLLHGLGYAAGSAVGKAFLMITKKDMTDAGVSIADANAILAEVASLQGEDSAEGQGGPSKKARTDAKIALARECLKPLQQLPAASDFLDFLLRQDGRRIPVSLEAFDEADLPEILIAESSGGLSHISSLVEAIPFHGGEEHTTAMMSAFIPVAMQSLLKNVSLPGSEHYLRFDYSGNKTEKRSSNPSSVLSQRLDRPDMLLTSSGATVLVGEDKAEGHLHEAAQDIVNYVQGGFSALQYGAINYLPCYAAAGLVVKLGMFNSLGKVQWMKTEFDMSSSKHRALFLFAVSNLTRWITLVAQQLPELALRMLLLLKPWERDAHVTITLQSAGRVYKQIKRFGNWVESHSPGSDFHFVASVYKIANCHPNLVHTRKSPQLVLRKGNYEVTLEQYGPPANPQTLQDIHSLCRDCCGAAAALHAENVVMRDFRLPNVLTRHGAEGDYVVVDMECAGPDCTEWSLNLLDKWDANTLNEMRQYDKMSDMHQIGLMIDSLPVSKPEVLKEFVDLLVTKQLSASEALQHQWIVQGPEELCSLH